MTTAPERLTLTCAPRTTIGKANRALRKSGSVPAVIFGEAADSISITINAVEFAKVFARAGETSVVYCIVEGSEMPTLVSEVSVHSVFETVNHVDFRRVNLKKKISAKVPVQVTGESSAVKQLAGVMLQQMKEIEVEALPADMPHEISVDISTITEVGAEIKISDIPPSDVYQILDAPERVIISVVAHKEESTESQLERSETEITSAKPDEGATTDGTTPTAAAEPASKEKEDKK